MADDDKTQSKTTPPSIGDRLIKGLKEGETIITGIVTRVIDAATGNVHFRPTSDVSRLNLEGHRIGTGDLVIAHNNNSEPQKLDSKRGEGDPTKVGSEIAIVHTGRQ
jgi:hypothetical protein